MIREDHDLSGDARMHHRKKFGGYNDFPPNWTPVEESEFWNTFLMYHPSMVETRQMYRPDDNSKPMVSARIYHYGGDSGYAIVTNYDEDTHNRYPTFFKFYVCDHKMVTDQSKSRMCYHVSRCTKCGYESAIDSSD